MNHKHRHYHHRHSVTQHRRKTLPGNKTNSRVIPRTGFQAPLHMDDYKSYMNITIDEIREIGVDFAFTLHEDMSLFMHLNPEFIYLMH